MRLPALLAALTLLPAALSQPHGWHRRRVQAVDDVLRQPSPTPNETFWVLLVGDAAVGKSALVGRFVEGAYPGDAYHPTLGAYSRAGNVSWGAAWGGGAAKLQVWDTAGRAPFRKTVHSIYRAVHAVAVVWDPQNRASFESAAAAWLPEARQHANPRATLVLVASKADMPERDVGEGEALALAARENVALHTVSAKTGAGVEALFAELAQQAQRRAHGEPAEAAS